MVWTYRPRVNEDLVRMTVAARSVGLEYGTYAAYVGTGYLDTYLQQKISDDKAFGRKRTITKKAAAAVVSEEKKRRKAAAKNGR